jgi:hypothetical protein
VAGERSRGLVDFFKQVSLFEDLSQADLRRLARIVRERAYRDGEYIFEEGKPGTALYIVRGGVVEIVRRKRRCSSITSSPTEATNRKTFRSASNICRLMRFTGMLQFYVIKTTLQSRYNIEAAANPQGRLSKKNVFIHVHRFLLVSFVFLSMKPLVVVHFYLIKPLYDIPEELLNIVPHFMMFSKF